MVANLCGIADFGIADRRRGGAGGRSSHYTPVTSRMRAK